MVRVCVAALLLAGCSSKSHVDVTLTLAPSLVGTTPQAIHVLTYDPQMTYNGFIPPPGRPLAAVERFVYDSELSDGAVDMTVELRDPSGVYGCGRDQTSLSGGKAALSIRIDAGPCPSSGGGSDGGVVTSSCANQAAHPEWLLCDGFDGPNLDTSWGVDATSGVVQIDPMTFVRGTGSANFHLNTAASFMDMGSDYEVARIYQGLSATSGVYVRAFMKLPASTVNHTTNNSTLMKLIHTSNDGDGMYLTWNPGSQLGVRSSNSTVPFDKLDGNVSTSGWSCVEWQLPTTSGDTHLWIDGVEATGLAGTGLAFPARLMEFVIGPDTAVVAGFAADLWVDDLVVSTMPVGCAN